MDYIELLKTEDRVFHSVCKRRLETVWNRGYSNDLDALLGMIAAAEESGGTSAEEVNHQLAQFVRQYVRLKLAQKES